MKPTFCLVDPCLKDFVGHYFEYDHSLVAPAQKRGYQVLVLGHNRVVAGITELMPVERTFAADFWNPDRRPSRIFRCNYRFYRELRAGLARARLTPNSVIFTHMITDSQLLAWAWYVNSLRSKQAPRVTLLLRYQLSFYDNRHSAFAFRLLERGARRRRVRLATDSERLARSYGRVTSLPVEVFPIPHTAHTMAASQSPATGSARPLRLVSLGNARDEKGFFEILGAIRALHRSNQLDRFAFVLQCNDAAPEIQTAISDFVAEHIPNTQLIAEALDTEQYYALLHSADAVLLPYWRSIYEARTSGIYLEAVAAGKPVIVPEDTWMSDQLRQFSAGVTCRDRDAADLARAILELSRNHELLTQRAREGRIECVRLNNPDTLVAAVLGGATQRVRSARPRRAAVFYPWGDILDRRAGASVRCNLLIDFLKEHVEEIRVLQPGPNPEVQLGNVRLESYRSQSSFQKRVERVYHLLGSLFTLGRSEGQDHMLWYHLAPRLDRRFKLRVLELVRWADVVFLEYTFWGSVVIPACRNDGVPIILTDYDIVAEQVTKSYWLRQLTRNAEFEALRAADHVVCVSSDDQQLLRRQGIAAEVVPHPVDIKGLDLRLPREFVVALLEQLYDIVLPGKKFCFFVGSGFPPNVIAVETIRKIARRLAVAGTAQEIGFLVAGGCAAPERSGNFIALGNLDDIALRAVYRLAELILIPLPFGTGASIKTIEAMATAKPVLGTRAAFRGFPVTSGVHCLISDDVESYPGLILEILNSPERAQALAQNARQFAEAYDYRHAYRRYLELAGLDASCGAAGNDAAVGAEFLQLTKQMVRRAVDRKKPAIAMPLLSQWLMQNPDDGEAHYLLARSLHSSDENAELALGHYARALVLGFDEFSIRLQRARLLQKTKQSEAANAEMKLAVASKIENARTPGDVNGIKTVVWELFHKAEYDGVLALVEPMLAKRPENGELHYLVAQSLHNSGRVSGQALEHYTRALECGFDEFWVRFNRARLLRELGQAEAGRADLGRAAALRPDDPAVRDMLFNETKAHIWEVFHASKYDEALALVRPLLAKHPENGELHYLVAQSLHSWGRAGEQVLDHYTRALEHGFGVLPQDEFWVRFHRGRLLWEMRRTGAARADVERAVALRPTDPMAERLLCDINAAQSHDG